jgi:3-carboxy-cis,cis-muconate cycloisomerase
MTPSSAVTSATDLRELFSTRARQQRYLDVEAALARAEAELGVIPPEAGEKIAAAARVELLDLERVAADEERTGHPMMPLVSELSRVVGPPEGGWVHWGATTQNIQQPGDVLGLRLAVDVLTHLLCDLLEHLAQLGERTAQTVMAGRTHGQQAVPITFGLKVAAWADPLIRHLERLDQLRPRLCTSMTAGAAGTFASLGDVGPAVQRAVAERLGLAPMTLPSRGIADQFAELVCVLGLIAATGGGIADEVERLMAVEFGEVSEPIPPGDVGSSTMPQKRNAKLSMDAAGAGARVRALVPLALEAMIQSHEGDGGRAATTDAAVTQACIFTADLLRLLDRIVSGLHVDAERMRANLDLSRGLISAEAVMLQLGATMGRQDAHEIVHEAARRVATRATDASFAEVLAADPRVTAHLSPARLDELLDPANYTGLSARLATGTSARARRAAHDRRP